MKLFKGEGEAKQYLQERVPPKEKEKEVDLSAMKESLFKLPDALEPGHHEFEGKGGLKISFDVVDSSGQLSFNKCYPVYASLIDRGCVKGEMRTIYNITNLEILADNFEYDSSQHSRSISVTWLPKLQSINSELSHKQVHIDKGEIYLIGNDGFFSTPLDLAGFFHELGHIETRTPKEVVSERNSVKTVISSKGVKTEPMKIDAYELKRERDANAWMLRKTRELFEGLKIPPETIREYVSKQLQSYHEKNRDVLEETTEE